MKIKLAFGCSCSEPIVSPLTWDRVNASTRKDWFIHYRFYDPQFINTDKYPYQVVVKGMNCFKSVKERQEATRVILEQVKHLLVYHSYNPITGASASPVEENSKNSDYVIDPDSFFLEALDEAAKLIRVAHSTKININSVLRHFKTATLQLRLDNIAIKNVKRRHIKLILNQVGKNKRDKWTANNYNYYRAHLQIIFKELVQIEAIDHNPINQDLLKEKVIRKIRAILTDDEINILNTDLRASNFDLWRLAHMFTNSGSRTTEFLNVQKKNVYLKRRMVKYTILKGKIPMEVERPIKDCVYPFWEQYYLMATKEDQYLFSEGLRPGDKAIRREQITRRWQLWVKEKLGILADWYALKHLNSDKMDLNYGSDVAAHLNKHAPEMVEKIYATGHKGRIDDIIKRSGNSLMVVTKKPV